MSIELTNPPAVSSADIERYIPGNVVQSTRTNNWDSIFFRHCVYPTRMEGSPMPATSAHALIFFESQAVKGRYRINGNPWKKACMESGSWTINPAYQNSVSWIWDALSNPTSRQMQPDNEVGKVSVLTVNLLPQLIEKTAIEVLDKAGVTLELPHRYNFHDPLMKSLINGIHAEVKQSSPCGKLFAETAGQLLAVHLLQHYCTHQCRVPVYQKKLHPITLDRVLDYIHSQFHEELSLETMAALANMSRYHFSRAFKKSLGMAPHQYVMMHRVEKAKHLLKSTHWPIQHITLAVGYQDRTAFSRIFKRVMGITPAAYRRCA